MTAASEAPALESRVGHYYQMDGTYLIGREKLREYARAVQDYHPAHWDVDAAAALGYSGLVAPVTFTSTPGMSCNRRMFESVVVGYDTWVQTEEVFEAHRPIVEGDELHIDVELTAVRRIAGRDLVTVTNTFTDQAGERVHTLHTTVVGVTSEDVNPAVKAAVQRAMMHDVDIMGIDGSDANYTKTVRPESEVRIADDSARTRRAPHPAVPRRPGQLCRGGGRRQPDPLGRGHRQAGRSAGCDRPRDAHDGVGCRVRLDLDRRPGRGDPLRGSAVRAGDRLGHRRR
jgi:acyl dehydratase